MVGEGVKGSNPHLFLFKGVGVGDSFSLVFGSDFQA